jgi:hypothetical protein
MGKTRQKKTPVATGRVCNFVNILSKVIVYIYIFFKREISGSAVASTSSVLAALWVAIDFSLR